MSDAHLPSPLRLRGHTLLCLQGFRGEGYSRDFTDNLAAIHRSLSENPDHPVELVEEPDMVCGACPHRAPAGCTLNGNGSEAGMQAQDRNVLQRLGLSSGSVVRWRDVLERIRISIKRSDLPNICGSCRWLPLGYCAEGIEKLRSKEAVGVQLPPSLILPLKGGGKGGGTDS
jgi:uncharacterized protein